MTGFVKLPLPLIDKIIRDDNFPLSTRVYFLIVQLTIGWNKEFELISLSMFQELLHRKGQKLTAKPSIRRVINDLVKDKLITEKDKVYSIVGGGVKGQAASLFPSPEPVREKICPYKKVIDGFNKLTGKKIKLNSTSEALIKKAFANKYSSNDILKAFKNRLGDEWWMKQRLHKDFPSMFKTESSKGDPVDFIGKFLENTDQSDFDELQEKFKESFKRCMQEHGMTKAEITECLGNRGEPPPMERSSDVDLGKMEKSTKALYELYKKMADAKGKLE